MYTVRSEDRWRVASREGCQGSRQLSDASAPGASNDYSKRYTVRKRPIEIDAVFLLGFHERVVDSDEDASPADARSTVDQQRTIFRRRRAAFVVAVVLRRRSCK